jgi:hypothetical protein
VNKIMGVNLFIYILICCFQLGTPWADGTASISQCSINPGETFHYRLKLIG